MVTLCQIPYVYDWNLEHSCRTFELPTLTMMSEGKWPLCDYGLWLSAFSKTKFYQGCMISLECRLTGTRQLCLSI